MLKILFVCHGNICRSPMAEFVMKDLVEKASAASRYEIASAATTYEEIGNPVYPPVRRKLAEHGLCSDGKTARHITWDDYNYYDFIIGMDDENREDLLRLFPGDPKDKIRNLPDYSGNIGGSISDPWYTRDFESTWKDVLAGCTGLFRELEKESAPVLDFSACETRSDVFAVLQRGIHWENWFGTNLDALYDILTDLPSSLKYRILRPAAGNMMEEFVTRVVQVFEDADKLA